MSTDDIVQKVIKHLEKSLLDDLKDSIKAQIQVIVKEEFKEIHERLARLERTMDMWKSDLDEDRSDLKDIRKTTEYINTDLKVVGKSVDNMPKKIEDTVNETVQSAVNEAVPNAVNETFEVFGKRVKVVEKPRGWLKKLKFW